MARDEASERVLFQLRAVLRGISPLIWRRLLAPRDTSIAQLHDVLQVAFGWEDMHLHRYEMRGREYGLSREGGASFDTNARKVRIGDLKLRRMERITYEYDFRDHWIHDIRIEATLPIDPAKRYRSALQGNSPRPLRTAADRTPSWEIAGSTRQWVAVNRVRNWKNSSTTWRNVVRHQMTARISAGGQARRAG